MTTPSLKPCAKCGVFHTLYVACFVVGQTARATREAAINSRLMTIHSSEDLHLQRPLHAKHLIVHLGRPGPTVEVGEHDLTWERIEYVGAGHFTITRRGVKYLQITQDVPATDQRRP